MRGKLLLGAAFAAMALTAPAFAQQADPAGDASTQARIDVGQTVAGELSPAGDTDWYRLRVETGLRYSVTMDSSAEEAFDTMLFVHDAAGNQLAFNDDAGGTLNSALWFSPREAGDVFIEARGFSDEASGLYRLSVQAAPMPADDAGGDANTRARVTPGQPINGVLELEGDTDWYRLSARAGNIYRIALNSAETGEALRDPYLRVVNRDGEELAANDDYQSLNSYLEFAPTRSGDVFVVAGAFVDAGAGAYTLNVETTRLPADNASGDTRTRGRLNVGGSINASLEYPGDVDWYRIRLEQGESYRFSLDSGGESEAPLGDPLLRLYDSRGTELAMDDDGGGGLNSMLEFTAPTTGNYFVEARGYGDNASGSYTLRARPGDIPGDASTDVSLSASGDYREGTLAPAGDRDWYRIDLEQGQGLRILLAATETADALADPYIVFYGPDGQEVGRDDDGGGNLNAWFEYQAATAGPHYLEVRGFQEDASGRYAIMLNAGEIGNTPDGAESISVDGIGRQSVIGSPGDVDWFVLEMIEGRPYRISLDGIDPDALSDPYLTLYNSEGREIASDDDGGAGLNAYLSYASPTGGPYFIGVSAYGSEAIGRYHLRVTDTDVPGHIYTDENLAADGDDRNSSIEMPGDLDYYRVVLEGGVAYQIDVRGAGEHPLADPYLVIVNENNERITDDDDSGPGLDARVRFTPSESGTYYIQASGLGGSTGSYQVSIVRR